MDNPAKFVDRRRVKPKELHLPSQAQFQEMATHIETSGAGQAKEGANLFRFLAFFTFEEGGLGREPETGATTAIEPVSEFTGQIPPKWHPANTSFARTDVEAGLSEIDINQS